MTTKHEALNFGIPYASMDGDIDGPISGWFQTCPVCGEKFYTLPRNSWKDSETPITGYAAHYEAASR